MGAPSADGGRNQAKAPVRPRSPAGRKRKLGLDEAILDAALSVLAEHGYDHMTIDMVAARAGSARATVYRRWATKADLVLEAVIRLSRADSSGADLPDTGELREDMVATILPLSDAEQQLRIQAVAALLALAGTEDRLAGAARAGLAPWIEVNRKLIRRAVDRGEFPPPADLDTLAELIPMMCISRAVQQQPISRQFSLALIDGVILPALRGGQSPRAPETKGTR